MESLHADAGILFIIFFAFLLLYVFCIDKKAKTPKEIVMNQFCVKVMEELNARTTTTTQDDKRTTATETSVNGFALKYHNVLVPRVPRHLQVQQGLVQQERGNTMEFDEVTFLHVFYPPGHTLVGVNRQNADQDDGVWIYPKQFSKHDTRFLKPARGSGSHFFFTTT